MFKFLWGFVFAFCLSFFGQVFASEQAAPVPAGTVAEVKLKLLGQLETDGYLSHELADEARLKYVTPEDRVSAVQGVAAAKAEPSFFYRLMAWTNLFYVLGVVVLLVAFAGWIVELAALFMSVILAVPREVYQGGFLLTGMGLISNKVWLAGVPASYSFYLALFGAIASLVVLTWVLETHPRLAATVRKVFAPGRIPLGIATSFWAMLYFGGLALGYQSEIFGFIAAVAFSGMLTFTVGYGPGVLWMTFEDKALPAMVFGNLAALLLYTGLKLTGNLPADALLFEVGLTYYCTIAMGVGFLVGASPFDWRSKGSPLGYLALFILTVFGFLFAYVFFDFKVVGSILAVFGVLLALEWHAKLCMKAGFVLGMFLLGVALVGLSWVMEHYGYLLVLATV